MSKLSAALKRGMAILAIALCGCAPNSSDLQLQGELTLDTALAQVDQLAAPEELRTAMRGLLLGSGQSRFTSRLPSQGIYLEIGEMSAGIPEVWWQYSNPGDYDQNGEVNVADLSVLGAGLGLRWGEDGWWDYGMADGDNNNEINISDLTPIGVNLLCSVAGYRLEYSPDGGANWEILGTYTLADAEPFGHGGVLTYDFPLPGGREGLYRVVAFNGLSEEIVSNLVDFKYYVIPAPGWIQATQGDYDHGVQVYWQDMSSDGYTIYRADSEGGWPTLAERVLATGYSDLTAEPGVHYWYSVSVDHFEVPSEVSYQVEGWAMDATTVALAGPPAGGNGTPESPYTVSPGQSYQLAASDSTAGDVTTSPDTHFAVSEASGAAIEGSQLVLGPELAGQFTLTATYVERESEPIYFATEIPCTSFLIFPDMLDPDWQGVPNFNQPGAGTSESPAFVLHNQDFNPDADGNGLYDFDFQLRARECVGPPISAEELEWGCFPPHIALDIDMAPKGVFHANQFTTGYVFATHALLGESNHLFVEVAPD